MASKVGNISPLYPIGSVSAPLAVKNLKAIAEEFRLGDEQKAIDAFVKFIGSYYPKGEGVIAWDIYSNLSALCKDRDWNGDFGRDAFYRLNVNEKANAEAKARVIEMAMLKVLIVHLENNDLKLAKDEFKELPSRLQQQIEGFTQGNETLKVKIDALEACREQIKSGKVDLGVLLKAEDEKRVLDTQMGSLQGHVKLLEGRLSSQGKEFEALQMQFHGTLQKTEQSYLKTIEQLRDQLRNAEQKIGSLGSDLKKAAAQFEQQIAKLKDENEKLKVQAAKAVIPNGKIEVVTPKIPRKEETVEMVSNEPLEEDFEKDFVRLPDQTKLEKFEDYVRTYCQGCETKNIVALVNQGKELFAKIQKGQGVHIPKEERLNEFVPFIWYLMYYAVVKGYQFDQGTIVVRDPGHAIAKFFLEANDPIYPRLSSHFNDRYAEAVFKGMKKRQSYGVEVEGLPGKKQTVNFAPISSLDGLDLTFFKPEDWGLGTKYQFFRHVLSTLTSISAHYFGNPNGPNDHKEHIPPEIKKRFKEIYVRPIPPFVNSYGIAGMKLLLKGMLSDSIPAATKESISTFLEDLAKQYDHLDLRKGNEAVLGDSILDGLDPARKMHQSVTSDELSMKKAKDMQMRLKVASDKQEALDILHQMKGMTLSATQNKIIAPQAEAYLIDRKNPHSLFDQKEVFKQVNKDINSADTRLFVDGKACTDAKGLYEALASNLPFNSVIDNEQTFKKIVSKIHKDELQLREWYECIASAKDKKSEIRRYMSFLKLPENSEIEFQLQKWFETLVPQMDKKQEVLRFMTLLHQGARALLCQQMKDWYCVAKAGLDMDATQQKGNNVFCTFNVTTGDRPKIEIKENYKLMCEVDRDSAFYYEGTYALLEGTTTIDYHSDTQVLTGCIKDK